MKEWEVPQIPEWGEANKPKAIEFLQLLDKELATRQFAAGDDYSIADITGMIAVDFMKPARIPLPEEFAQRETLVHGAAGAPERQCLRPHLGARSRAPDRKNPRLPHLPRYATRQTNAA